MRNQRETFADMELFASSYKKLIRCNFDRAIPKIMYNGKEVDITEEIIYLYALRCFKEKRRSNLSWYSDLAQIIRPMRLDKKSGLKLFEKLEEIIDEFNESNNIIIKSPDDIFMLNSIRLSYMYYKMEFNNTEVYKWAIEVALGYLQNTLSSGQFRNNEFYVQLKEDKICRLCIYAVLAWLSSEDTKVPKDRGITKLIHKYIGTSLEDMVGNEDLRYNKLYFEYKNLCTDEYTQDKRNEFWDSNVEFILSDMDKLNKIDFDVEKFKLLTGCTDDIPINYIRTVNDSFKNCFSKYYEDINEIPDEKSKKIIFNLIQRYLCDVDEIITVETKYMIKSLTFDAVLYNDLECAKEQSSKDIEKLREQNRIKVNKAKKEAEQLKEQLNFAKDKNDRLVKELKKTDKDAVIELESKIDTLESDNDKMKKKNEKYQLESERLNARIEQLEKELRQAKRDKEDVTRELIDMNNKNLDTKEDDTKFSFQSKDIPSDVLYSAIKDKKILLVGGNKIHSRIIERGYTNIDLLRSDNVNITMHAGQKYDLVVIYTKLVSHSVVERVESELKNSNIPIIRFNQAGINTLLYTIFMYVHGGYEEAVGKYLL